MQSKVGSLPGRGRLRHNHRRVRILPPAAPAGEAVLASLAIYEYM